MAWAVASKMFMIISWGGGGGLNRFVAPHMPAISTEELAPGMGPGDFNGGGRRTLFIIYGADFNCLAHAARIFFLTERELLGCLSIAFSLLSIFL